VLGQVLVFLVQVFPHVTFVVVEFGGQEQVSRKQVVVKLGRASGPVSGQVIFFSIHLLPHVTVADAALAGQLQVFR